MNISILSVFPDLYKSFLATSLMGRAQEQGLVSFDCVSFFSYVSPKERIDAPTFGHGAGMLIKPEVIQAAIEDKERVHGKAFKIFFSPHGKTLDQPLLQSLAHKIQQAGHCMLIAGRYEGMDARVEQAYADEIISVGDYVLMGGDLPAMTLLEGMLRLIPGVVGKKESIEKESFSGPFVDHPEYTEPVEWNGMRVPDIVRSGNHAAIGQWQLRQAAERTLQYHADWALSSTLNEQDRKILEEVMPPHYLVLMHSDVLIGKETKTVGTTSVTSLDIHDIARSCKTYGIKNYFLVTPLEDQQKIVSTLLNFWHKGVGVEYNRQRHEAVRHVRIQNSLDDVITAIQEIEGVRPLIIGTSARHLEHKQQISFYDQGTVWSQKKPVLFIFGTGQGLAPHAVERCDLLLPPVGGLSSFRHLSVRSAVAVILDRWMGLKGRR